MNFAKKPNIPNFDSMNFLCIHQDMKSLFLKVEYLLTELEQLAAM